MRTVLDPGFYCSVHPEWDKDFYGYCIGCNNAAHQSFLDQGWPPLLAYTLVRAGYSDADEVKAVDGAELLDVPGLGMRSLARIRGVV